MMYKTIVLFNLSYLPFICSYYMHYIVWVINASLSWQPRISCYHIHHIAYIIHFSLSYLPFIFCNPIYPFAYVNNMKEKKPQPNNRYKAESGKNPLHGLLA